MLFMLVATIAATATYKWITSEGRSSASRMLQREAYQSSIAGIENTRAWMTFHANDVGALVRQYLNNNPRIPINLDGRLRALQRQGQDYHVWLTGVNTENSTYKLKILSSGEARNGSRHNEVAILNVDGLYRVTVPQMQFHHTIDFDFAYYGGSYTSAGKVEMTSGVVNGNWSGNPPIVQKNWIVTGNATLSGNDLTVGQTACIGGNASIENNGITTTDLYVGGDFDGLIKRASGSVYFNGDGKHTGTGSMIIDGNMTVNGFYQTAQNASDRATRIGGNLCVSDSGAIVSKGTSDLFLVNGNVWMPGPQNLWYGSVEGYGCVCNIYSPAWASDASHLVSSGTPCTKSGADWGEGKNYVQTSCAGKRLTNSSDNQSSYDKIILGDSASDMIFISSALSLSTYNSTLRSKSFTENSNYKKYCPDGKKISSNDEWSIGINAGGSGICPNGQPENYPIPSSQKNICGTWGSPHWEDWSPSAYYVLYTRGWENWGGGSHKPYPAITDAEKKYAIYYTGGATDVSFGLYNLPDWYVLQNWVNDQQRQIRLVGVSSDYSHGECIPYKGGYYKFKPDPASDQMGGKFSSSVSVGAYYVGGDVFYDVGAGTYNGYNYDMTANVATGSPYCKKGSDDYRPVCGVTPWFKANGTVSSSLPYEREFACAEGVMTDCYRIWEPSDHGCDGSKFLVDDPVCTPFDDYAGYATKGCAASITTWGQSGFEAALNSCYSQTVADESLRETNLYNGYLVVRITSSNSNYSASADNPLNGKFIIIVDNKLGPGQNGLPRTTSDSKVFLYLNNGASYLQKELEHYFIYINNSSQKIESSNLKLTGTLYSRAAACATVNFQSSTLTFDKPLVDDLTAAGVINNCTDPNNGNGGGEGEGGEQGQQQVEIIEGGPDSYYISMAPQLAVRLESQSESSESLPVGNNAAETLDPSFIVLPRVIYLPRDAYGKLSDYYSIVPLNGADLDQEDVTVQCSNGLRTETDLYDGTLIDKKVYTCVAKAAGYSDIPFWVAVNGELRGTPQVSFVEGVQEMGTTGTAHVHINLPARGSALTVLVGCPATMPPGWNYQLRSGGNIVNGTCVFEFQPGAASQQELFEVTTSNASNGTVVFQLLPGEGYALSAPFISELHVSNLATIVREDPTLEEIDAYCDIYPEDCPAAGHRALPEWPNCPLDTPWVEPVPSAEVIDTNNVWTVPAGGVGTINLEGKNISSCVIIIPMENNTLSRDTIVADHTYKLRAIAKARKSSIRVGFKGDVGTGKNPRIIIDANTRDTTCFYDDVKDSTSKTCVMDLYSGETVSVSIAKSDGQNTNFNYWKCENNGGNTCPTTEPITSAEYTSFTIKDNNAVIYAHFGEVDKHCFFDEFKQNGVECQTHVNEEYCIDNCGNASNSVCVGAVDANGSFTNSKWHLVEGSLDNIEDTYESVSIDNAASRSSNRSNREAVKVMSTVQAGLRGTLKALVQLPKATSSFGVTSPNIAKSGFLLHSNAEGTEFLMLNVFVNAAGKLEARLCPDAGTENCISTTPERNGNNLSVSTSSMVMVEALLSDTNTLELTVFSGNYYGTPDTYTSSIKLYNLPNSYGSRDHEYVGFGLADPNFKIYGIGWSSGDYGADECWDTYPTVKCSFSAVAASGVIPVETDVEPWLGHSGWFDTKSCTPVYYYDNGTDACSGSAGAEVSCPNTGYNFSLSGAGQHGYRDNNGVDVKAAKAWLSCISSDDQVIAWSAGTENRRAHCGMFWTGKFTECTNNANIGTLSSISSGGMEGTITLTGTVNLRGSKLNITLENSNNSEIEVWLLSENDTWGADDYASSAVRFSGNSASFDVVEAFADGAQGFDPENVKQVVVKNLGENAVSNVTVSSTCKNAVGISECEVAYNDLTGKWEVSADVSNKSKVSSYAVTGKVNSSDVVTSTSAPSEWNSGANGDRATWKIDHNPYESYQGSTFNFSASVTNASGETFSTTCTPAVTIGSISCSNYSANNIASGATWPAFNFKLNNCPQNSCEYEIWFDGSPLSGNNACTEGACSGTGGGSLSRTKSGNAEECTTDGGCSHSYEVRSTSTDKPFTPCEVSFKVNKKLDGLSCTISPTSITLGQSFTFSPSWGGSCTSTTLSGSGVSNPTPCQTSYSITPTATGDQTYSYSFTGDLGSGLSCPSTLTVTVNPPKPDFTCPTGWAATVGSSATLTLNPTYCDNNACTMKITGIDNDFVAFSSPRTFTDAGATTSTNKYTVAIKNGTGTTTKDCSITYTTTSSTYRADCWFDKNGEVTAAPMGYQYTNFKVKTIAGFPSNTNGKVRFNGNEYNIDLYSNGNTSQYSNLPMPNTAGSYPFEVVYNSEKICEGSITVAYPVTCSVDYSAVTSGSNVTFTAAANTTMSSTFGLDIAGKCGFKINGNWKDNNQNQNLSSGTHTQQVNARTEFTFACNNGYSCSKTVVLANPPEIACAALTSTKKTGDPVSIKPTVEYCANNCEWHISGYETLDHNTRDWSSGGTIGLSTVNSDGAKNYKLTVENDYGDDDCDFTITYSSGEVVIPVNAKGKTYDYNFEPGKTYSVTLNTGGVWRCAISSHQNANSIPIGSFNDQTMSFDGWQTQATTSQPGSGHTVTFTVDSGAPSDMYCDTDYY